MSYIAGPNQPPYRPLNYDRKFEGPVTLRHALEDSRNIPAVKALEAVGPDQVVGYAKRLGLTGNYPPYLSLALGAAESTLLEMTSAYSAFANQGVRMTPYAVRSVSDREGTVIEENRPEPREALRADTAFLMAHLLRGRRAARHRRGRQVARVAARGQDRHDGRVHRRVVRRVRPQHHRRRVGGLRREETARAGARPARRRRCPSGWTSCASTSTSARDRSRPPQFEAPGNIVFVTLPSGITEAFINGTQPAGLTPDPPATQPAATPAPAAPEAAPSKAAD